MQNKNSKKTITPENFTGLQQGVIPEYATGVTAIKSTLEHIARETGYSKGFSALNKMNQKEGFDCPGCAWPDPKERSSLGEYCENGAKAIAEEATKKKVDASFFTKHSVAELLEWSDYELGKSGRITEPLFIAKGESHYRPISWDAAFTHIGKKLQALPTPNDAIFYTSGRTSNEAAFLYQLFARKFGTNNLPDCSNMCHESSGKALGETIGIGKGTVKLDDFSKTDLVIVMGQNPGTNHPRMLSALRETKKNGGKIITINPLPEVGLMAFKHPQKPLELLGKPTKLTDLFLQVKINGDVALLKAFLLYLVDAELTGSDFVLNTDFIKQHTAGYENFVTELKQHNIHDLVAQTGIPFSIFNEAAALIAKSNKIIICWAMGLTQHKNAVDNIREAVNILLLKGSIGIEGGGVCPVRGHSNVQGDRTMGIWEAPPEAFLDKLGTVFNFSPPRKHGYDVVNAIKAMKAEKDKVFIAMGGNFISATPDTELTAQALRNCKLTVQISTKLNRSHLVHGTTALILPCLGRSERDIQNGKEQFVTVENSMGVVHQSKGHLVPVSDKLLSEPMLVAKIATATFEKNTTIDWIKTASDYTLIRDIIAQVIPGFDNYNEKIKAPNGFYLPNNPRNQVFDTPNKKANFTTNAVSDILLDKGQFLMMTIRTHDQFNTTIYGLDDRYRGIYNERRVVLMNRKDMATASLVEQTVVHLISHYQGEERKAHNFKIIGYDIPKGCIATYFPEANILVPINQTARKSNTPASKSIIVSIERA